MPEMLEMPAFQKLPAVITIVTEANENDCYRKPKGRDVVDKFVNVGSGRTWIIPSRKVVLVYLPCW